VLRFADGTTAVVNADGAGTTVGLKAPLAAAQSSGAVATLAPEDIPRAKLPTVHFLSGCTLDGDISLHACNFSFDSAFSPVGGEIHATPSARMIGEATTLSHKHRPRSWGGGGSPGLAGMLGWPQPAVVPVGLAHLAHPGSSEYMLQHSAVNALRHDDGIGSYLPTLEQNGFVATAEGWDLASLTPGPWTIRALVREPTNTAAAIKLESQGGPSLTTATVGDDWEWIEVSITATEATRTTWDGFRAYVQQLLLGVQVDVAAIVCVPTPALSVLADARIGTAAGPRISTTTGAPTHAAPNGSINSQVGSGGALWLMVSGAWTDIS
jgi:hypothetical protein